MAFVDVALEDTSGDAHLSSLSSSVHSIFMGFTDVCRCTIKYVRPYHYGLFSRKKRLIVKQHLFISGTYTVLMGYFPHNQCKMT
jgi:hypothetical protein